MNGPAVAEPVTLGPRALALLTLLVERRSQSVAKDEIFDTAWPGMAVEEAMQISGLRRVLDPARQHGSCMEITALPRP